MEWLLSVLDVEGARVITAAEREETALASQRGGLGLGEQSL